MTRVTGGGEDVVAAKVGEDEGAKQHLSSVRELLHPNFPTDVPLFHGTFQPKLALISVRVTLVLVTHVDNN